ncbi:tannase/feruloyl esterase family alpha/beta hydrolase [Paraburkholderia ginsengiterrae]|nr:tannase/feruloyl esterase family alpha/beta hydrolase [Paraburkholderia ginsengiterrae]
MKTAFKPDANTTVTLVKAFKKGDDINLNGKASGVTAANDECLVKLNVGPGNPGPAGAPSTSAGIGVEVWLPSTANWNGRIHVLGGGGFAGYPQISSLTDVGGIMALGVSGTAADVAGVEGAVSAITDTGHISFNPISSVLDGSFLMNPDGSINTTLATDFTSRSIHQMAVQTKALATAYYSAPAKYSYWDGCSTGGRQGLEEAQSFPDDFDGILAGDAAANMSRFQTAQLFPQVVMQQDLGGVVLTPAQVNLVSSSAVSACDTTLTGQHDGFISDAASCNYDPTQDKSVLCTSSGGTNTTSACVTTVQARAVNKIWYGMTTDGSVPAPQQATGFAEQLQPNQLWFGYPRGAQLTAGGTGLAVADSANGVPMPIPFATQQVALELQKPSLASPFFQNATGNGTANGWMSLSYASLASAFAQGVALNTVFGNINTDSTDLSGFKAHNGKLITFHGMADPLIPPQGSISYFANVANGMGGVAATQNFYRLFLIPGMGHCAGVSVNGITGVSPPADPPQLALNQLYAQLKNWVENGVAPDKIPLQSQDATITRPICMYPSKLTYRGGPVGAASSFTCS